MADTRSPEQIVADDALVAAIEQNAKAYGMIEEGWALGDYVVCVEFTPFSPELSGRQRYGCMTPMPTIPIHRVIGLLELTVDDVRNGDDDEGEDES